MHYQLYKYPDGVLRVVLLSKSQVFNAYRGSRSIRCKTSGMPCMPRRFLLYLQVTMA